MDIEDIKSKLTLGSPYKKKDLANIFQRKNLGTHREGIYSFPSSNVIFLFVDLEKSKKKEEFHYNDYFEKDFFHWDSQKKQHLNTPRIQQIVSNQANVILFARVFQKIKNKTEPFIFCGSLEFLNYDPSTTNPIHIVFESSDYDDKATGELKKLYDWSPKVGGYKTAVKQNLKNRVSRRRGRGQGFNTNSEYRKAVEEHGMKKITKHYQKQGFKVTDTSSNKPYDLMCKKNGHKSMRIEVKGTSENGGEVTVTRGEVESTEEQLKLSYNLAIVHSIEVEQINGKFKTKNGKIKIIENWKPDKKDLTVISYRYKVPPN